MIEKKNQPCYNKEGEFIGWLSPAIAVSTFVLLKNGEDTFVAATKRGKGCPNNIGKWNCQCGYLDFKESTLTAAKREVFEEIGIKLDTITDWKWIDEPDENENIVHRFYAVLKGTPNQYPLTAKFSEKEEVSDIAWINVKDIDSFEWAFNHDSIIKELLSICN